VSQLLGLSGPRLSPVRRLVADLAVGTLVELARADAAVVAHRSDRGVLSLAALTPEGLGLGHPLGLEAAGRLWVALDRAATEAGTEAEPHGPPTEAGPGRLLARDEVHAAGDHHLWLAHSQVPDGTLAAVLLRRRPYEPAERALLARLVTSVAVAVTGAGVPLPAGTHLRTLAEASDRAVRAEVLVSLRGRQLRGAARAGDAVTAAARATAALFDDDLEVRFAGQTPFDDAVVTVVVVVRHRSPVLGLAVTPAGSTTGPAEAVLSAVASLLGDPVRLLQQRSSASS
jgi:hypothetical protein